MKLYPESIKGTLMRIFSTIFLLIISILSLYAQVDESAMQIYNETFKFKETNFSIISFTGHWWKDNTEDLEYIRDSFQDVHTALASIKSSIRRFSYIFGAVAGALVMHIYYDL